MKVSADGATADAPAKVTSTGRAASSKKMRNSRLYRDRKPCLGKLPMYIPEVDKVVIAV